jgi:hypothetical protein
MSDSPFSDSKISESLKKIDTDEKKSGDVEVRVSKDGVEAEAAVAVGDNLQAGGWFRSSWNGAMEYAGLVKWKW